MKSFVPALCIALSLISNVAALPAADIETRTDYPTVIPGPGLPSIESLGLTSAEYYRKKPSVRDDREWMDSAILYIARSPNELIKVLLRLICWKHAILAYARRTRLRMSMIRLPALTTLSALATMTVALPAITFSSAAPVALRLLGPTSRELVLRLALGKLFDHCRCFQFHSLIDQRSRDVALAVEWIFTNCNNGGQVGGSCAANGNGGLVVGVENINW